MKEPTKTILIAVMAFVFLSIFPQKIPSSGSNLYCWIYLVLENKDRHCYGNVYEECMEPRAPWGNWGVDSNLGARFNGHQFQGWKHIGNLYQWHSCTDPWGTWPPPQLCGTYYNDVESPAGWCWEQHTAGGSEINTHAVKVIRMGLPPGVG